MAYIPNPNQSVSGTVGASVIGLPPVNLNVGGNPVTTVNPVPVQPPASGFLPVLNVGSVITVNQGSIATVIIGGSITASFTPPSNQSVSGTVQTDVRGSIATVIIGGSIAASFTPPSNQSVSGTVHVDNFSSVTAYQLAGSVLAVSGSFTPAANQSVSGTVQTDVRASVAVVIIGGSILTLSTPNQSVSGAVSISNFPTTQNISGSVVTFQGTPEWTIKSSLAGGIFPISGSVAAFITNTNVNVSGSVVAFGFPTNQNISGSVAAWLQSTNASVITVGSPVANQSVSGTVGASIIGHAPVVIVGGSILTSSTPNQSVSGTVGASIIGQPTFRIGDGASVATIRDLAGNDALNVAIVDAAGNQITTFGTSNQSVSGTVNVGNLPANQSVSGAVSVSNFPTTQNISGSVAAWLQSTNASVITVGTSVPNQSVSGTVGASIIGTVPITQSGLRITSVISSTPSSMLVGASIIGLTPVNITNTNINVSGSVVAFQGGTQITSISGIIQASVHGAVSFSPASVVSGHASINGGQSVLVLQSVSGLYNYVTDFTISNTGAATTLVTFTDSDGSILGKTIAPAGGGSNATGLSAPMRTLQTNKAVCVSVATATSTLHIWMGGYKAS